MRIIPILFLGIMSIYFYLVLLRFNTWTGFNLNKILLLFILFLIVVPALNFFGVWFLTLFHLFEIGILVEILNIILKRMDLKYWNNIYLSFAFPIIAVIIIFCYGYYNINNIKRTEYNILTEKNIHKEGYKIGLISDIHFGNSLNNEKMEKQVEKLNSENFDILILAGDIVDESTSLQEVKDIFKILGKIKTEKGIYYVYGNHDMSNYSRKPNYSLKDLKDSINDGNIKILEDESIKITEDLTIIGRKDKTERNRKNSRELIEQADKNTYLILTDHQPVELIENSRLGYDLQLSGHTHNGQIFPFNLIMKFFNLSEFIYGNKKIGKFNIIVSSGFSGWGYPIRTAGNSEYVVLNLKRDNIK